MPSAKLTLPFLRFEAINLERIHSMPVCGGLRVRGPSMFPLALSIYETSDNRAISLSGYSGLMYSWRYYLAHRCWLIDALFCPAMLGPWIFRWICTLRGTIIMQLICIHCSLESDTTISRLILKTTLSIVVFITYQIEHEDLMDQSSRNP
jgi:hypothetical protein